MDYLFFSAVTLLLLGLALIVALRVAYGGRAPAGDPIYALLCGVAVVLLVIGWLAVLGSLGPYFGSLLFFASLAIAGMAWRQFRLVQRRTHLALLALAIEKQIPLPDCVDSLAAEFGGRFARWAGPFSRKLKSGALLPDAIQQAPRALPKLAGLAAQVGQECNCLDAAFRDEMICHSELEPIRRAVSARIFYFLIVLIALPMFASFFFIKIVPAYIKIYSDFEVQLPAMTQVFFNLGSESFPHWFAIEMLLAGMLILLWGALWYAGIPLPELPLLRWLGLRLDRATLQRALAFPAERQQPLGPMIELLARYFPSRSIRRRLRRVDERITNGQDWIDALRSQSLLGQADVAVLTAAQRARNLPWALREMAASNERRTVYRWQTFLQVSSVVLVLLIGALVAFVCVACFVPLVKLIQSLA